MSNNLINAGPKDRFDHLLNVLSHDRFLNMDIGGGGEVPFFICPYDPKDSLQMERAETNLIKNLKKKGISVLALNLYDLTIDMMKKEGDWEHYIKIESSLSKKELLDEFKAIFDSESYLIPAIKNKIKKADFKIMFISGVGNVFPYIRAHNLLNNLQSSAKEHPTVIFFPGEYSHSAVGGASLNLFNKFNTDHYYRAFNIYDFQV